MKLYAYIHGVTHQLERRVRELRSRIPRKLPRDYDALAQKCREKFDAVLEDLRSVRDDFPTEDTQSARLRQLRRTVADLSLLETVPVAALDRARDDDHRLNHLLYRITREINYPLITPVVTTLSTEYFHIYPEFNLLSVPLSEGKYLLHLPDLYHELAHPLLTVRNEPHVEAFQCARDEALAHVLSYLHDEKEKERRRQSPDSFGYHIDLWELLWIRSWLDEFFCDLFAVYTLGPPFVWSHLHLSTLRSGDPFEVPTLTLSSHPADDARMRVMLIGLATCGFNQEAANIEECWRACLDGCGASKEPEYDRCYPLNLLRAIASSARNGVSGMNCRLIDQSTNDEVHLCLVEAWNEFRRDPKAYANWEEARVQQLGLAETPSVMPAE